MRARILLSVSIAFIHFHVVMSQVNPKTEADIQQRIEELFPFQDDDINYDEAYESLLLNYTHPLDLNEATKEDLESLYLLSRQQIEAFFRYRQKHGDLLSVYELQAIPDLDNTTIRRLIPFITVNDASLHTGHQSLIKRILTEPNNYLLLRYEQTLEKKRGYSKSEEDGPSGYVGSRGKHYARFRTSHSHDFSIGFTLEKDDGEQYAWKPTQHQWGPDFYSFHFQLQNKGKLKSVLIGDYQIQYGQSLLQSAGFTVGKGSETITTIQRSNLGIRPYTSVLETGFFRGIAATYQLHRNLEVTPFYSRKGQDGIIRSDSINTFINALQQSGYHRTTSQLQAKNAITEEVIGGTLLFKNKPNTLQVGATFITTHFDVPISKRDVSYNRYAFSGDINQNLGVFYKYGWQNISLFGEVARSRSGGTGMVYGTLISLSPALETSFLIRNYTRDFHAFYGNAFAETSSVGGNEKGWYWGLRYKPNKRYELSAYFDQFSFPWLRATINAPSSGYEYLFKMAYKPAKNISFYGQYRLQVKEDNPTDASAVIRRPLPGKKRNYTLNLDFKASETLSLRSKVQFSNYQFNGAYTQGFAIIQDVSVSLWKIRVSSRMALFDTDDYENRQYAYERDVLYAFSIPAYSGRGVRQYLLMQYPVTRAIDLYARFARTRYRDRDTISSGLEEIDGTTKSDIKFQLRIKF